MQVKELADALEAMYPEAACSLDYEKDYELLFSTRLAAQCTDARVNIVAKTLYARYPTLEAIASAAAAEMEEIVRPCGFYRHKARDLISGARKILSDFGGRVPGTMEELLSIPGVGRKTANLALGTLYGKPAVVADTHCIRLSNRLGLCDTEDPYKVELALAAVIPPERQLVFCHCLVHHGRAVCAAKKPRCGECGVAVLCPSRRDA